MKPKRADRKDWEREREIQKAIDLAEFYAFMLREPGQKGVIDDQTNQCVLACVRGECYFSNCLVYSTCPMESWRISLLN